jgi:DNA-binding protein H-NS
MARPSNLEKMSFVELSKMQTRIERLKADKQASEREAVRKRIADMASQHGFDVRDLFGKRGKGKGKGKGSVAVKYRDPRNPGNTWTGRGRPPRWMTAAINGGSKRDDFLI